jgi:peroxiredoxin
VTDERPDSRHEPAPPAPGDERPGFRHQPARHGLVGPFTGRQLSIALLVVVAVAVGLVVVNVPIATPAPAAGLPDPAATPYFVGDAPSEGLRPGDVAPELAFERDDGSSFQLTTLDGTPVRLADLRGKALWINFWASWCPPCQAETPVLREVYEEYRDRGLELVAISVQETSPEDVGRYAERYELPYPIAADLQADVFHRYRVYALPTQFFVGPDGVIRSVVNGPLDLEAARAQVEAILPEQPPGS